MERCNIRKYLKSMFKSCASFTVISNIILFIASLFKARNISDVVVSATEGKVERVILLSAELIAVLLAAYILNTLVSIIKQNKFELSQHECKCKVQKRLLENKLSDISKMQASNTLENFTDDLSHGISLYSDLMPGVICSGLQIVLYGIFLGAISPIVLGILTATALIQVLPPIIVKKYMEKNYAETRDVEAEVTDEMIQAYNGLKEIKRYNAVGKIMNRFSELHKKVYKIDRKNQLLLQTETAMDNLVNNALTYGTYAVLGLLAAFDIVTIEEALQAIILSAPFYASFNQVFQQIPNIRIAKIATERLAGCFILNGQTQNQSINGNLIRFNSLSYGYNESEQPLFSELNCSFPIDEISVIVGKNGSGKSTLMKLVAGWTAADDGGISFCGADPNNWNEDEREKYVFYLPQIDPGLHICAGTLFCAFSDKQKEKCFQNAALFGLSEEQLNTRISDLSGGESKKIFLSAAFSTDKDVFLLLDEPTNSLDEKGIDTFISLLRCRQGALVITHDKRIRNLAFPVFKLSEKGVTLLDEKDVW